MSIMIEGPDKAGKTTLAKAIAAEFKGEYKHFGVPPPGSSHVQACMEALQTDPRRTVYDRFGLSAFCYDFIDKRNEQREMTDLQEMEMVANEVLHGSHMWIIALTDDSVLRKRLLDEGDANDYVNVRELVHINHTYELLWKYLCVIGNVTALRALIYDSASTSPADFIAENYFSLRGVLK